MSVVASFKNFRRQLQKLAFVQVLLASCGLLLGSPKTLCRIHAHRACIHIVLSRNSTLQQFYSEYQFHYSIGIYGIYACVQSLTKLACFALGLYEALLGSSNCIDKFTISLGSISISVDSLLLVNNTVPRFIPYRPCIFSLPASLLSY